MKRLLALSAVLIPIYLFAQGFGGFSSDQPFFAKDVVASSSLNISNGLWVFWADVDYPASPTTATIWTNRIDSNGDPSLFNDGPTAGFYIKYQADGVFYNGNNNYLVHTTNHLVINSNWTLHIVFKRNQTDAGKYLYGDNTGSRLISTADDKLYASYWFGADKILGWFTNGVREDITITQRYDGTTNYIETYSNGILITNVPNTASSKKLEIYGLGSDAVSNPWIGWINRVLIYTNWSDQAFVTLIHSDSTNTYGYSP